MIDSIFFNDHTELDSASRSYFSKIPNQVQNDREPQHGRTMLEMLGVLGIMGIITYGAISGINSGMTSYKVNQLYIEISDIINGIQEMYLTVYGKGSFPNLTCNTTENNETDHCKGLINNGILRKNMKEIKIEVKDSDNSITVTFKTTNNDLCTRLKDMDWAVQSITTTANCESSPYTLTFTPK